MGQLEFENLTVVYNTETDYSKKNIKRTRRIEILCTVVTFIVIIGASVGAALVENFVLGLILALSLMALDMFIVYKLMKKIAPPHYDFISWINNMEQDEIEVGWFNDRYMAIYKTDNGWKAQGMKSFLISSKYELEDKAKKDKPIHMTIDLSKETAQITVENI